MSRLFDNSDPYDNDYSLDEPVGSALTPEDQARFLSGVAETHRLKEHIDGAADIKWTEKTLLYSLEDLERFKNAGADAEIIAAVKNNVLACFTKGILPSPRALHKEGTMELLKDVVGSYPDVRKALARTSEGKALLKRIEPETAPNGRPAPADSFSLGF